MSGGPLTEDEAFLAILKSMLVGFSLLDEDEDPPIEKDEEHETKTA